MDRINENLISFADDTVRVERGPAIAVALADDWELIPTAWDSEGQPIAHRIGLKSGKTIKDHYVLGGPDRVGKTIELNRPFTYLDWDDEDGYHYYVYKWELYTPEDAEAYMRWIEKEVVTATESDAVLAAQKYIDATA